MEMKKKSAPLLLGCFVLFMMFPWSILYPLEWDAGLNDTFVGCCVAIFIHRTHPR